jgi:hypothetical protein
VAVEMRAFQVFRSALRSLPARAFTIARSSPQLMLLLLPLLLLLLILLLRLLLLLLPLLLLGLLARKWGTAGVPLLKPWHLQLAVRNLVFIAATATDRVLILMMLPLPF